MAIFGFAMPMSRSAACASTMRSSIRAFVTWSHTARSAMWFVNSMSRIRSTTITIAGLLAVSSPRISV